jgi:DNA protecting protein DprA
MTTTFLGRGELVTNISTLDLMTLLGVPGVGPARVRKIIDSFRTELAVDKGNFQEFACRFLNNEQVSALPSTKARIDDHWNRLRRDGIHIIGITDDQYPKTLIERLGDTAPLVLICRGNIDLLERPSVGFCGSRAASDKGIGAAWDMAGLLATQGINVVSGFAAGVDLKAHEGALSAGGTTTIVLAEGLLRFRIKKQIKSAWDNDRTLVISEFGADQPWSVGHAMQRNRTICALSKALVLVEARSQGGSIEAGRECLKMGLPLFAAVYEGMPESADGNEELLRMGAKPLMKSRTTNKPNIRAIVELASEVAKNETSHAVIRSDNLAAAS